MSKKILSVVLALVFVLSTFAVSAFAINGSYGEDENTDYTQTWVLEETDNGDGTWTVAVKLTTNYAVGAIQFKVLNSNPNVTLDKEASKIGAGIPANYGAMFQLKAETGKVLIVPEPEIGAEAVELTDAVIAELVYNVPAGESATLTIDGNDAKTEANPAGTLVALRMVDEVLESGDMVYGQIVTKDAKGIAAKAQLGSASAPAELVVKDGTNGVIDDTRMCVYGIDVLDEGQTIGDVFDVTNGGYIEVIPSVQDMEEGTGAILVAKDANDEVIGEYTVIIHGDVNGDGCSDSLDGMMLFEYEVGTLYDFSACGISDEIAMVAGDINADGGADSLDGMMLFEYEVGTRDPAFDITTLPQELLALA